MRRKGGENILSNITDRHPVYAVIYYRIYTNFHRIPRICLLGVKSGRSQSVRRAPLRLKLLDMEMRDSGQPAMLD